MKRETYFAVTGVVAIAFGIAFVLLPAMSLASYGMPTEPANILQSRYFGSALATLGLVWLLARKSQDIVATRAMLVAALAGNLSGAAISLYAVPLQNGMVWLSVAIYAAFAAGAAFLLFASSSRTLPHAA